MNTIVNITGLTLNLSNKKEESVMQIDQKRKSKGYYKNLITVLRKENPKEYARQWTFLNKERKKLLDIKNKNRINFMRREKRKTEEGKKRFSEQKRRYQEKNREKITKRFLEKRKKDPYFKLLTTLRSRLNAALKKNIKSTTTKNMLGCTIEQLWVHLEKTFKPGMTKENHGTIWHIDHIVPCASFDLTKPEEQAKCFHYSNLQALFVHENLSKGSKYYELKKKVDTNGLQRS
jgi:hypothetical protein